MDGVLVETRASYHRAVLETVTRTLPLAFGRSAPAMDGGWVTAMKRAGGFNNDWDLTAALVRGLVERPAFDILRYADELALCGGGLAAVDRVLGVSEDPRFDPRGRLYDLFQELYLGEDHYRRIEGRPRALVSDLVDGLIATEAWLLPESELDALPRENRLGIVTGRPRAEAHVALDRSGLGARFEVVVTHDDVVTARAHGKPDPWPLQRALGLLGASADTAAYLGDQPDDMRAALAAGMTPIGIDGGDPAQRAALSAAGAVESYGEVTTALRLSPYACPGRRA